MELIKKVRVICEKVVEKKPNNFSGIGLVVYDSNKFDDSLHCNLRNQVEMENLSVEDERIVDYLCEISDYHSEYHDGFHMMNEKGKLTYIAQYFVPPIISGLIPNQDHGVRVHSSLCGSTIEGVLFIAVVCSNYNIYIFKDGKEID